MYVQQPTKQKNNQSSSSVNTRNNVYQYTDEVHSPATVSDSENKELLSNDNTGEKHSSAPRSTSGVGYWLSLHYSDQGTGAFVNLMSFLCLSSAVGGVRVVEPFIVGSNIGQNASANWKEEISFSETFDSDNFHHFAESRGCNPYQRFLRDAPRKVLVAQYISVQRLETLSKVRS